MTTTDSFTEAASVAANERFGTTGNREVWMEAAEWARAHLAAQEPTDAEVLAVLNIITGEHYDTLDQGDPADVGDSRAALSAARAARRDEEKR